MLKIGISQRVEIIGHRKERRDCLDQAWAELLQKLGYIPIPLSNTIKDINGFIDEVGLSGIILSGGNDLAHLPEVANAAPDRDVFEKKLLRVCSERQVPLLGVCRGMQLLVSEYGGELTLVDKHVQTLHSIKVCSTEGMPLSDRDEVNSYHRYGILRNSVRDPLTIVATSEDDVVEAVQHKELPQWGIMWHPERPPRDSADPEILKTLFKE